MSSALQKSLLDLADRREESVGVVVRQILKDHLRDKGLFSDNTEAGREVAA